jgi:hypothetical protein
LAFTVELQYEFMSVLAMEANQSMTGRFFRQVIINIPGDIKVGLRLTATTDGNSPALDKVKSIQGDASAMGNLIIPF